LAPPARTTTARNPRGAGPSRARSKIAGVSGRTTARHADSGRRSRRPRHDPHGHPNPCTCLAGTPANRRGATSASGAGSRAWEGTMAGPTPHDLDDRQAPVVARLVARLAVRVTSPHAHGSEGPIPDETVHSACRALVERTTAGVDRRARYPSTPDPSHHLKWVIRARSHLSVTEPLLRSGSRPAPSRGRFVDREDAR
jgi:hypothetical protein